MFQSLEKERKINIWHPVPPLQLDAVSVKAIVRTIMHDNSGDGDGIVKIQVFIVPYI